MADDQLDPVSSEKHHQAMECLMERIMTYRAFWEQTGILPPEGAGGALGGQNLTNEDSDDNGFAP
jgi:hypothetical protein